ncbi:MAG: protein kinase [Acidobacteriota bacterium]
MIGKTLGPYEITAKLGEGGMGEVYRATDSKLKREVAIKVLPEAFVADPERLARFEREAQLLAQLNHPNIAHVYGLEAAGKTHALVMELVDGEDLSARIARGALPLAEALAIAKQIAEALEAAHERGIVHRDLKPANVKVQADTLAGAGDAVKVLDFGLAKAMDAGSGAVAQADVARSPTLMNSPTLTAVHGTQLGVILGTAAYMAPEQARGGAVDKRADIWAFGVVLYEMLTGRSLFAGPTVSDTLAGVLKTEVDFTALPPGTPRALRALLRRMLERNPKNRLHDIADARIVLDEVLTGRSDEHAPDGPSVAVPAPRSWSSWIAVAAVALALGFGADRWLRTSPPPPMSMDSRWALALPEGYTFSTADAPQIAISRDGRAQAVVGVDTHRTSQILLRRSEDFEPKVLEGTEGALSPFFSPNGDWIGFLRDDALMKVPTAGGPAIRLAAVSGGGRGATWGDDGFIYFAPDYNVALSRVPEAGGKTEAVTKLEVKRSERTHRWPDAFPDGDAVLYTSDTQGSTEYYDDARIEVVRPSTGEHKVLVEGASQARFAPGGFVVFGRSGSLYAVRFDARTLTTSGTPREVTKGVAANVGSGAVQFAIAWSGAAIWTPGGVSASYRIVWVDRDGRETPVPLPPVPYQELALSPDHRKLALVGGQGGVSDLWVADLERSGVTRLTTDRFVRGPVWSPDGTRLAYSAFGEGEAEPDAHLEWQAADGSRPAEVLFAGAPGSLPSAFSPDGSSVLFEPYYINQADVRIWSLSLAGEKRVQELPQGGKADSYGVPSLDGKWLAYVSLVGGQDIVYVRPYPRGEGRWQVSVPIGDEPRWGPDGRSLYYRSDSVLYRVAIETSHGFSAGRPEAVLDRVASGQRIASFGFSSDGSRIITFRAPPGSGAQRTIDLDLGFASRLAQPAGDRR